MLTRFRAPNKKASQAVVSMCAGRQQLRLLLPGGPQPD